MMDVSLLCVLCVAALLSGPPATAQTQTELDIQTYAGLTVTGAVGQVYSIEYVTDLTVLTESDWRCLEFLQLPASPYLWVDRSAPATEKRFSRAVAMQAPTNMVFIPPGTCRMGSPTNEVDRWLNEGPQTAVVISRGFFTGRYELTQGEYAVVMRQNPSFFNGVQGETDHGTDLNRPVETVRWDGAVAYCVTLTQREWSKAEFPATLHTGFPAILSGSMRVAPGPRRASAVGMIQTTAS